MYSVREHFDTYQSTCEKGTVNMKNRAQSRVVGIAIVWIHMFDGVVQTVTRVRHVSNLKRNLISLGTLDARDKWYLSQGEALKASKGIKVVMKEEMYGGLYRLIGNVQMGEAARKAYTSDLCGRYVARSKGDVCFFG